MNISQGPQESGIAQSVHLFGKCCGGIAAICATPKIFMPMRPAIYHNLQPMWGDSLSGFLTWGVGLLEAGVVYSGVTLVVASAVTLGIAWVAAKRFLASLK